MLTIEAKSVYNLVENTTMERTLEERVTALEEAVARLMPASAERDAPWWEKIRGTFRDDPVYDEITRLGAEWRRSQPIPGDDADDGVPEVASPDNHDARKAMLSDKEKLRRILEEQDKVTGFVFDPTATPQQARQMTIDQGIRPEDNSFSSEILQMRYGDDLPADQGHTRGSADGTT